VCASMPGRSAEVLGRTDPAGRPGGRGAGGVRDRDPTRRAFRSRTIAQQSTTAQFHPRAIAAELEAPGCRRRNGRGGRNGLSNHTRRRRRAAPRFGSVGHG
jgi:hypothetical protein